jgi:2'-5' RNA ligase
MKRLDDDRRLFAEPPRDSDKVYFALKPDAEDLPALRALAEQLSLAYPLTGRPDFATLHISVLGLGHAADLLAQHYAVASEVGRTVRLPPFQIVFTRLMSFGAGRRQMPLALIADDDSAQDVNDLALMLRGELLARGFPPGGRVGGQAHMTLLHDGVRVPEIILDTPIVLRPAGIALIRNHHGEGRHETTMFGFGG